MTFTVRPRVSVPTFAAASGSTSASDRGSASAAAAAALPFSWCVDTRFSNRPNCQEPSIRQTPIAATATTEPTSHRGLNRNRYTPPR